jgi:hypothetical protein
MTRSYNIGFWSRLVIFPCIHLSAYRLPKHSLSVLLLSINWQLRSPSPFSAFSTTRHYDIMTHTPCFSDSTTPLLHASSYLTHMRHYDIIGLLESFLGSEMQALHTIG